MQLEELYGQLQRAQEHMLQLVGQQDLDVSLDDASSDAENPTAAAYDATTQVRGGNALAKDTAAAFSVDLSMQLQDFALYVSGRPADVWWPDEVIHAQVMDHLISIGYFKA